MTRRDEQIISFTVHSLWYCPRSFIRFLAKIEPEEATRRFDAWWRLISRQVRRAVIARVAEERSTLERGIRGARLRPPRAVTISARRRSLRRDERQPYSTVLR